MRRRHRRGQRRVLTDALLTIGFDTLTDGRKGFMNVSRSLLVGEQRASRIAQSAPR